MVRISTSRLTVSGNLKRQATFLDHKTLKQSKVQLIKKVNNNRSMSCYKQQIICFNSQDH